VAVEETYVPLPEGVEISDRVAESSVDVYNPVAKNDRLTESEVEVYDPVSVVVEGTYVSLSESVDND
jgi:hypothetical protein